jgi:hypothetical protein
MASRWDIQREFGRDGERFVADWLRRGGLYVIPSYDYTGDDASKAPKLEGAVRRYVIPDLDVAGDGQRCWVEVKTKSEATHSIVTNTLDHGFEERLLLSYQHVQQITGTTAWLCVYELSTGYVLLMLNDHALADAAIEPRRRRVMVGKPHLFLERANFFDFDPQEDSPPDWLFKLTAGAF